MANKTASVTVGLTFTGGTGATRTIPTLSVVAQYLAQDPDQLLDVPSGATGGNEYDVAFGTIGTEATSVLVKNGCSVPISVRVNGATGGGVPLAPGGLWLLANPTGASGATGDAPVTSMKCVLGGTQTGGSGEIAAWTFGDPS